MGDHQARKVHVNHEDVVLRQIAELEELEALEANRHELDVNTKNQPVCPTCLGDWHGLENGFCPGAWATKEQKLAFEEHHAAMGAQHFWVGRSFAERVRMSQQAGAVVAESPREGTSFSWTHQVTASSALLVAVHHPNGALLWSGYSMNGWNSDVWNAVQGSDLYSQLSFLPAPSE